MQNVSTGTPIGEHIECADGSFTRMRGLLGRTELPVGHGLWIKPSSGVHTFGMRFSIDVIGLDRELRVMRLWRELRPWRVPLPSLRMHSAVELAAGEIDARGIRLGHRLVFLPRNDS